jgi:hypothetical protein
MAVVASIKAGDQLRLDDLAAEAANNRRAPGFQIVIVEGDGSKHVAFQPPQQAVPMIDVTPPATEPVPSIQPAEAE